jgi:hypothetical protein
LYSSQRAKIRRILAGDRERRFFDLAVRDRLIAGAMIPAGLVQKA